MATDRGRSRDVRSMRIHIIGINYRPEQTGIAVFTTGRAEYLASRGHHVTVCTTPPYYPQWRVGAGYRRFRFGRERIAGVNVLRCPLYVPSTVTPLRRVLHEASFIVSAFVRSLFVRRPDVLVVISPPLGLALVAAVLGFLWRVPYVFDVQDLQPDAALDLGMIRPGRLIRLLFAVERLAYRRAARVSTITEAMRARIVEKGVPGPKVVHLSLWADAELFALPERADGTAIREALGLGDAFVVLHAGNIGVKQGLGVVLDAAARLPAGSEVRYVLLGDGAMRSALEARARELNLVNVQFVPLLPRDGFQELLATADVCLIAQQRTVGDIVFPSKVLTLMAAAKPLIASVTPRSAVASVIGGAAAGLVIPPDDPDALNDAVQRLRGDAEARACLGAAGREYARRHWEQQRTLSRFAGVIEQVAVDGAAVRVPGGMPTHPGV